MQNLKQAEPHYHHTPPHLGLFVLIKPFVSVFICLEIDIFSFSVMKSVLNISIYSIVVFSELNIGNDKFRY